MKNKNKIFRYLMYGLIGIFIGFLVVRFSVTLVGRSGLVQLSNTEASCGNSCAQQQESCIGGCGSVWWRIITLDYCQTNCVSEMRGCYRGCANQ